MRQDKFRCDGCGSCCKMIGLAHPEFDRGDLCCVFLKNNKCQIYKRRPSFCNVYETWKRDHADKESWPSFERKNRIMCMAAKILTENRS